VKKQGYILADIQLADGSSGLEAVNELLTSFEAPVIFITEPGQPMSQGVHAAQRRRRTALGRRPQNCGELKWLSAHALMVALPMDRREPCRVIKRFRWHLGVNLHDIEQELAVAAVSMPSRSRQSPIYDMVSWLAAAVLVTAGVIYGIESRHAGRERPAPRPPPVPNATPAQEPLDLQLLRAAEIGRGRHAGTPSRIPWRGWKDIVFRTYHEVLDDRILALAGSVTFYSLLALFPAIAAGVSVYALFADAATISRHLSIASDIIPSGGLDLLGGEISRIAARSDGRLTSSFLAGLAIALWSANAGMKALFDALNVIYDEQEKRSIIWLNAVSLFFTVCAIGAVGLAVAVVVVFPLLLAAFDLTSSHHPFIAYLRWPVMLVLLLAGLSVLYRYGPSRHPARWRWISVGSLAAALLWLAVSSLFSWYLGNIANYDATYGTLGAAVGLMMWMWLSAIVILIGAEFNSEIEHQTARDSTVGSPKPLGTRGAVMADTVGRGIEHA
jgi:membrane protein